MGRAEGCHEMGHVTGRPQAMTCGWVRLICEEPQSPPAGQEGQPVVIDVQPEIVDRTLERLQANGWQVISQWNL